MPCPTCDHTMTVVNDESQKIYQCPRCGTTTISHFTAPAELTAYVPKLVERCRQFEFTITGVCAKHADIWNRLGIMESINPPEKRPFSNRGPDEGAVLRRDLKCPTCDRVMHRIGCAIDNCLGSFYCGHCGTVDLEGNVCVPLLVHHCRKFEPNLREEHSPAFLSEEWRGIEGCIAPSPEQKGGA